MTWSNSKSGTENILLDALGHEFAGSSRRIQLSMRTDTPARQIGGNGMGIEDPVVVIAAAGWCSGWQSPTIKPALRGGTSRF